MAEITSFSFNLKEITELLVKKADIHEGLWGITVEFALGATNISAGPDDPNMLPAAIVPVKRIGIQKSDEPTPLTVDAALVNPVKSK
jgi:hypothetical protein